MELGESLKEKARREAAEETGLGISTLELAGVYCGPDHWIALHEGRNL